MTWYRKQLNEHKREAVLSFLFALTFTLILLLWHYFLGQSFQWQEIDPISQPSLLFRSFYSAIAFLILGAFLYWIRFYQFLYFVFVEVLGDWQSFKAVKAIIWLGLILLVYYLVEKLVALLNSTISFAYNVLGFILYLVPPVGIAIVLFLIGYGVFARSRLERKP
jgi:hypothetical protein